MVTSRPTARATTPSALPNGARVNSSPWATAAITGAGAPDPRDDLCEQLKAGSDIGVGTRSAQSPLVDPVGGGEHVQPRKRLQRRALPDTNQGGLAAFQRLRDAQRAGEYGSLVDETSSCSSSFKPPPSSTADALAARSAASAAVTGQRRRLAR